MSLYPFQLDTFPLLSQTQGIDPSSWSVGSTQAPATVVSEWNAAITATEGHTGFSVVSGGDTRADATVVIPEFGRKITTLSSTWIVTATQDNTQSLFVTASAVVDLSQVLDVAPTAAPDLNTSTVLADAVMATQSPVSVYARRRTTLDTLVAAVTGTLTNQTLIALTLPAEDMAPFQAGEALDFWIFVYGGF